MVFTILDIRLLRNKDLYARKRSTSNVYPTNRNSMELSLYAKESVFCAENGTNLYNLKKPKAQSRPTS